MIIVRTHIILIGHCNVVMRFFGRLVETGSGKCCNR